MGACSLSGFDAETAGWLHGSSRAVEVHPLAECSAFCWKRTAGVAGAKFSGAYCVYNRELRTPSRAETHSKGNLKTNMTLADGGSAENCRSIDQ